MAHLSQTLKKHRFATLALSTALFGMLVGVVLAGRSSKHHGAQKSETVTPKVTSKTTAIHVVSAERAVFGNETILLVKLQNMSDREIKAYTIAGAKTWVTTNYFLNEESFAPGAIENKFIPLPSNSHYDSKIPFIEKDLTVAAVYFADGRGDGVPRFVSALADQHAGMRDQANRILPCLRRLSSHLLQEDAVDACQAEALRLPVRMEGRSSDYESGLENARQEILSQLHSIKEKTRANRLSEATDNQERVKRVFKNVAQPSP